MSNVKTDSCQYQGYLTKKIPKVNVSMLLFMGLRFLTFEYPTCLLTEYLILTNLALSPQLQSVNAFLFAIGIVHPPISKIQSPSKPFRSFPLQSKSRPSLSLSSNHRYGNNSIIFPTTPIDT